MLQSAHLAVVAIAKSAIIQVMGGNVGACAEGERVE